MCARLTIVTTADRPDLLPVVAHWAWEAFWRAGGHTPEETLAAFRDTLGPDPVPRSFVLLEDGTPVGTASLTAWDLQERPDLTPWLASVFVTSAARGRGHAARLVAAVEDAARAAGWATLWLYTKDAERIYARAGWQPVEVVAHRGADTSGPVLLMRRDLGHSGPAAPASVP